MSKNGIYRLLASLALPGYAKGKVQIFIFHRVLDNLDPLLPGEPDIKRFDQIMRILSEAFCVIPLAEAVERLESKTLPKRAACITFDDGYLDNYTNALPILKKYNLPATIFIATSFINRGIMWNDMIIESLRSFSGEITLPKLDLNETPCIDNEQRVALVNLILHKIKHLPHDEREEIVEDITSMTNYQRDPLMLNESEILELHRNNVMIGAHTHTHPILANLSRQDSHSEIAESKEMLESLLKDKVEYFAYPNGRPSSDYTEKDVDVVKHLNFKAAVSTRKTIATSKDDIYELPRFTPWDENLDKFALRSITEAFRARH